MTPKSVVTFACVRYYFFVLFATPKPSFAQLLACISLTMSELFVAVWSPVPACTPSPIILISVATLFTCLNIEKGKVLRLSPNEACTVHVDLCSKCPYNAKS